VGANRNGSSDIAGTVNTIYLEPQEQPQRVLKDESVEVLDDVAVGVAESEFGEADSLGILPKRFPAGDMIHKPPVAAAHMLPLLSTRTPSGPPKPFSPAKSINSRRFWTVSPG
jgi:hypothetical protein